MSGWLHFFGIDPAPAKQRTIINKNILFVKPIPPPINGQVCAFYKTWQNIRCCSGFLVNQNVTCKLPEAQAGPIAVLSRKKNYALLFCLRKLKSSISPVPEAGGAYFSMFF